MPSEGDLGEGLEDLRELLFLRLLDFDLDFDLSPLGFSPRDLDLEGFLDRDLDLDLERSLDSDLDREGCLDLDLDLDSGGPLDRDLDFEGARCEDDGAPMGPPSPPAALGSALSGAVALGELELELSERLGSLRRFGWMSLPFVRRAFRFSEMLKLVHLTLMSGLRKNSLTLLPLSSSLSVRSMLSAILVSMN